MPSIEQQFKNVTAGLTPAQCKRILPLMKQFVAAKETEYEHGEDGGAGGADTALTPQEFQERFDETVNQLTPEQTRQIIPLMVKFVRVMTAQIRNAPDPMSMRPGLLNRRPRAAARPASAAAEGERPARTVRIGNKSY